MSTHDTPVRYAERLYAPWSLWLVVMVLVGTLGVAYGAAMGVPAGLVTALVGGAVAAWFLVRAGARVAVTDGELVAGRARIPVVAVGEPVALDAERARWLRGPGADPAAYLLVRGWVPEAVHVEVLDPADPTPYWLISTRHPAELAAAIDAARAARR